MSVTDATLSSCVQVDGHPRASESENFRENVYSIENNSNVDEQHLEVRCFVCDATVQGRRYALATCKTQSSRTRVIEKLGELVGERYVVVISEDDVICRSCANVINTLDRLECEMRGVKNTILRFLEHKYSLPEGELIRCSQVPRLGQPPQITKSEAAKIDNHLCMKSTKFIEDTNCSGKKRKSSNHWVQCDKCCYTTLSHAAGKRHTRQPNKQILHCHKCGEQFPAFLSSSHRCKNFILQTNSVERENPVEAPRAIQTAPLETIDVAATNDDPDDESMAIPVMSIPSSIEPLISSKEEQIQLISSIDQDGCLRDGQPLFMRVLQQLGVNDELGQTSLIPMINNDVMVKTKENPSKQMLTLAEDGSLQMVAIDCWNEENQTDCVPEEAL
ncbi:uncharacterized protein pzg isoform X2 [Venturia canescens]|uniref:uncharacterized protein pzg isoform X2 n=1 Tax=Venturia canescens TaxID=32260 RepID=UPI001C9C091E|nr:uncharacterized protein LOC122412854 isoform X2 [Venturia canescens]